MDGWKEIKSGMNVACFIPEEDRRGEPWEDLTSPRRKGSLFLWGAVNNQAGKEGGSRGLSQAISNLETENPKQWNR